MIDLPIEIPELTDHEQDRLDALADDYSVELRADYNEDAKQWGIWCWSPEDGETEQSSDLIATGETVYQAIDEARDALRLWEQGKVAL